MHLYYVVHSYTNRTYLMQLGIIYKKNMQPITFHLGKYLPYIVGYRKIVSHYIL
jgi:hypothetical protein